MLPNSINVKLPLEFYAGKCNERGEEAKIMVHPFEKTGESFTDTGYYVGFDCPHQDGCEYFKANNECSIFQEFKQTYKLETW